MAHIAPPVHHYAAPAPRAPVRPFYAPNAPPPSYYDAPPPRPPPPRYYDASPRPPPPPLPYNVPVPRRPGPRYYAAPPRPPPPRPYNPDAVPIDAGVGVHATAASPGDRAADAAPPGAGGGGIRGAAALAIPTDGGRALKTRLSIIWAFVPKRASLSLVKHGSRNEVPLAR